MATDKKYKGGVFLRKKQPRSLGEKALGKQPDWQDDGSNREQTNLKPVMKSIGDGGTQPGHPAKGPQPKTMRFLNRG